MKKERIAIIGSGISGLTCAWLLKDTYDITLYEAEDYIGGHTQTTDVTVGDKVWPVNTGFIVFNDWTYPNFIRLLDKLGVASEDSDMSFSVRSEQSGLEYNGHTLNTLFAQRRNLVNPAFLRMIREILRFNRETREELVLGTVDKQETLGSYLQRKKYSAYFSRYYIIPMGAAIWSASEAAMMEFPLFFFLRFFNNHGMLSVDERPQWRVVSHGSRSYVEKIVSDLPQDSLYTNTAVTRVIRHRDGVSVFSSAGAERFDQIIFACHSDQALAMLADPSAAERDILGAIPYQENDVVLHTDSSLLPTRPLARAAWNYHTAANPQDTVGVTYYMNRLQNFSACPVDFCVTLNKTARIDPDKIIRRFTYHHPVFSLRAFAAQQRHHEISNHNRSHFCGAYWFNGFHEDGVISALRVTETLGVTL